MRRAERFVNTPALPGAAVPGGALSPWAQSRRPAPWSLPPARRQLWLPSKTAFSQMGLWPVTAEMPDPSGKVRGRLRAYLQTSLPAPAAGQRGPARGGGRPEPQPPQSRRLSAAPGGGRSRAAAGCLGCVLAPSPCHGGVAWSQRYF